MPPGQDLCRVHICTETLAPVLRTASWSSLIQFYTTVSAAAFYKSQNRIMIRNNTSPSFHAIFYATKQIYFGVDTLYSDFFRKT